MRIAALLGACLVAATAPAAEADVRIFLSIPGIGLEFGSGDEDYYAPPPPRYYHRRYYYDKDDYPDPQWLQEEYAERDTQVVPRRRWVEPDEPPPVRHRRYYDGERCNQPPLCLKE